MATKKQYSVTCICPWFAAVTTFGEGVRTEFVQASTYDEALLKAQTKLAKYYSKSDDLDYEPADFTVVAVVHVHNGKLKLDF